MTHFYDNKYLPSKWRATLNPLSKKERSKARPGQAFVGNAYPADTQLIAFNVVGGTGSKWQKRYGAGFPDSAWVEVYHQCK
jgi:hypothetical protein